MSVGNIHLYFKEILKILFGAEAQVVVLASRPESHFSLWF